MRIPEAISAVVKDNDVVIVHELTHAWQDRRDPVFREMTRGNLPDTTPLEYEEEAYKTKKLVSPFEAEERSGVRENGPRARGLHGHGAEP